MTTEQKDEILRLKRAGKGYKTIAQFTGINVNTVKTTCRRSGLFRDNPEHRALFAIPEPTYSTEVAVTKPLPPQRVITGHKQTDAYLWVLEVIKLNEPTTLSDVVREFQYWDWLYQLRNRAGKELGYEYGDGDRSHIYDREQYLESLLATIRPVSREEAAAVCKWVFEKEPLMDLGKTTENIILNLVGECADA